MVSIIRVYNEKQSCYGCSACYNACPSKAITMKEDREGFLYSQVIMDLCTYCGKCLQVCPIYHNPKDLTTFEQKIYGVKHRSEEIRSLSTSGGVFTALSDYFIAMGGAVYGAAFDSQLRVHHIRAITEEARDRLRGSKYVQSHIEDCFINVKKDMAEGRPVLFVGTPCQVMGLRNYLSKTDAAQLILCDIVCHGVPSPKLWKDYIKLVERKKKSRLILHKFRTKTYGWHSMKSMNLFHNGEEDADSLLSQLHMNLFLKDLILRPCCYYCKYASFHRYSDITLGDFWGIEKATPEYDDNKGISLVLINTHRGNSVFELVKGSLTLREYRKEDCYQQNLHHPTALPKARNDFWRDYKKYGYEYIVRKYGSFRIPNRIQHSLMIRLKKLRAYHLLKDKLRQLRR